jgi:cytoskeletal protein CcmA (bactofilin family)
VMRSRVGAKKLTIRRNATDDVAIDVTEEFTSKGPLHGVTVEAAAADVATESEVTDSRIEAKRFTAKGRLSGTWVTAVTIAAHNDVTSAELRARTRIELRQDAQNTLAAVEQSEEGEAGISVGAIRKHPGADSPTLRVDPETGEASDCPFTLQGRGAVENSTLRCDGGGYIVAGDLTETALRCEAGVWILGTFIHSSEDRDCVLEAGDLWVSEELTLAKGSEAKAHGDIRVGGDVTGRLEARSATRLNGSVVGAVAAERLWIEGDVAGELTSTESLNVTGELRDGVKVDLNGNGELGGPVTGTIEWTAPDGASLTLGGALSGELTVHGNGIDEWTGSATVVLADACRKLSSLRVARSLQLDVETTAKDASVAVGRLELGVGQAADLLVAAGVGVVVGAVRRSGGGRLAFRRRKDGSTGSLDVNVAGLEDLEVHADGEVIIRETAIDEPDIPPERSEDERVSAECWGPGPFAIDCEVGVLTAHRDPSKIIRVRKRGANRYPKLSVREGGAVRQLRGDVRLGEVAGPVTGAKHTLRPVRRRPWHRWRPRTLPTAPRVHAAVDQPKNGAGQLRDVDPTPLDYHELTAFRGLYVFEPDPHALMDFAREPVVDEFDRQQRAQEMQRLATELSGRAVSGNVRSAAMWAASRTHHRTVTGWERTLRGFNRAVGYTQRPTPALVTWVVVMFAWSLLALLFDDGSTVDLQPREAGVRGALETGWSVVGVWWGQFVRMLFLPISLIRLPEVSHPEMFGASSWYLLAFVTIGLPLVYLVLALKNYLASPVGDGLPPGPGG